MNLPLDIDEFGGIFSKTRRRKYGNITRIVALVSW